MTRFEFLAACPHCETQVKGSCTLVQGKPFSLVLRCARGHDFIADVRAVPVVDVRKCQQRRGR